MIVFHLESGYDKQTRKPGSSVSILTRRCCGDHDQGQFGIEHRATTLGKEKALRLAALSKSSSGDPQGISRSK
jgi:hypothetical protein